MTAIRTKPRLPLALWLLIAAGGGFVILLAVASWILRDQIFQTFLDPGVPYQTYQLPPEPDYATADAWVQRPVSLMLEANEPVVFFVHPTTYDGGEEWNAPFDRPQEREELASLILPNYAAPFATAGAVYAPAYRQASLYSFMNNREDSQAARLLAYSDMRRAFSAFLTEIGDRRPFMLVGVGQQGSLLALGLLIDDIATDEALRRRLAAAYLLEAPVPMDLFEGQLSSLPPCNTAEQTRCVIAFAAVRPTERERIDALLERGMSWLPNGRLGYVSARGTLCTNPLLWTTSEDYAPARMHRGGAAAENLDPGDTPSPIANQTGAQCQNGLLMIEQPRAQALRRPHRLGESRRVPPSNLFYADLQQDAERRMARLSAILDEEARYAPPLDEPEAVEIAPVRPID